MTPQVLKFYRRFRAAGMGGIVGQDALNCLSAARTLAEFTAQEGETVRIRMEPEQENYFDVCGEPDSDAEYKRMCELLDRWGCYWIAAEYRDESGEWQHADSIGMCVYDNPLSPYENGCVIDLMRAALDCAESASVVI